MPFCVYCSASKQSRPTLQAEALDGLHGHGVPRVHGLEVWEAEEGEAGENAESEAQVSPSSDCALSDDLDAERPDSDLD